MEGNGIINYANYDRYEGEFKNNMRNGRGVAYILNGNRKIT